MITPGLLPLPLVEQMREGENLAEHSQVPRDSKAPFDPVVPQIAEAPKLLTRGVPFQLVGRCTITHRHSKALKFGIWPPR